MKKQRSRKSFSLDDSIDEDRRKEEIIQKLIESSTNLKPKKLPVIKFDLEENEIPQQPIKQNITEYLTPQVVHNNLDMVRENLQIAMEEKLEESRCLNWTQLVVEFIKIIAYCDVLIQDKCSNQNSFWFFMMFLRDIIEITITIKIVNVVPTKYESRLSKKRPTQVKRESKYPMAGRRSHYGNLLKEIEQWESQMSIQEVSEPTHVIKYKSLQKYNQMYQYSQIRFYVILLIWGLLQLGQMCESEIVLYTFQGFILLGIITLTIKLIYLLSFKFCISAVVANYFLISEKNYQNQEVIQNLQKLTKTGYDYELCYLCQQEIKHLTVYIDLPCNKMHRFHEKCIEKWLYTNLVCPVCVEPIELMNYQMRILS